MFGCCVCVATAAVRWSEKRKFWRLVVSMAAHGTLNPQLAAKARVDIYVERKRGREERYYTHTPGRLTHTVSVEAGQE